MYTWNVIALSSKRPISQSGVWSLHQGCLQATKLLNVFLEFDFEMKDICAVERMLTDAVWPRSDLGLCALSPKKSDFQKRVLKLQQSN